MIYNKLIRFEYSSTNMRMTTFFEVITICNGGCSASYDGFVVGSSAPLRKAAKRWQQVQHETQQTKT